MKLKPISFFAEKKVRRDIFEETISGIKIALQLIVERYFKWDDKKKLFFSIISKNIKISKTEMQRY